MGWFLRVVSLQLALSPTRWRHRVRALNMKLGGRTPTSISSRNIYSVAIHTLLFHHVQRISRNLLLTGSKSAKGIIRDSCKQLQDVKSWKLISSCWVSSQRKILKLSRRHKKRLKSKKSSSRLDPSQTLSPSVVLPRFTYRQEVRAASSVSRWTTTQSLTRFLNAPWFRFLKIWVPRPRISFQRSRRCRDLLLRCPSSRSGSKAPLRP